MSADHEVLLVMSSLPDQAAAQQLARTLIERRLAACVSVLAPCTSVYRWQGSVEETVEIPVLIKTTAGRYVELESALRALHPYELPEIVAVPVLRGLPAYLDWVTAETVLPEISSPLSSSI
ncbi:MAG: divalent-cation tolerance protein CutA [Betaproteobacteria bacterium]